jgi:hypothetical protein
VTRWKTRAARVSRNIWDQERLTCVWNMPKKTVPLWGMVHTLVIRRGHTRREEVLNPAGFTSDRQCGIPGRNDLARQIDDTLQD